jgi:hypothetical protein
MAKPVRFTRHAQQKFTDLARAGFTVTTAQVLDAITRPESVDRAVDPPIAQKAISERHVIRVVFVEDEDEIRIVTFYPARRTRYEP